MYLEENIMNIGKIEPLKDKLIVECSGNYNNSLYGKCYGKLVTIIFKCIGVNRKSVTIIFKCIEF
ncbi:MAG: hypothetical protein IKH85_00835 [Methanobrevibacter sp.]|uniref:hypothetical protein n=1 Tax=Methanobrevibacter sp. TaxID=66852 RepID=UPI0025D4FC6E|nr:hypothetical protein [Methanobrevibacter sp.]MBR6992600.1 hypothetical protein [Methanobrevibacter sp.]